MKKPYFFYVSCILIAAGLLGVVSVFLSELLARGFTRYQVILLRSILACGILGLSMLLRGGSGFRIRLGDLWCFLGTGILNQLLFCVCYYTSISMVGVAVASVLMFTSPVFAVILSVVLFHERVGRQQLLALVLAMGGCVLVSGIGGTQKLPVLGLLLGLGSGLAYALGAIFNRCALQKSYTTQTITFYTLFFCMLGAAPIACSQPFPVLASGEMMHVLGLVFAMAVLCSIVPTLLMVVGQQEVSPGRTSMLTSSELVVATLVGVFVFQEKLTAPALFGMAMILAAVVLLAAEKKEG